MFLDEEQEMHSGQHAKGASQWLSASAKHCVIWGCHFLLIGLNIWFGLHIILAIGYHDTAYQCVSAVESDVPHCESTVAIFKP